MRQVAAAIAVLLITSGARAGITIVAADGAHAHIVVPDAPDKLEQLAAKELSEHVERITGIALPLYGQSKAPAQGEAIRLGAAANVASEELTGNSDDAFALVVGDGYAAVRGLSPKGTLSGVYALIEALGVRWYMPGDLGTVLPKTRTLQLATRSIVEAPSFRMRRINVSGASRTWARRMRFGGDGPPNTLRMPPVGDFDTYPQRYALVNGKRNQDQLCVTNPETIRETAQRFREHFAKRPNDVWFAIGNHGGGHCECDNCRALDPAEACGPYTGGVNVTDRYLVFVDKVFAELGDKLPDKRICLTIAAPHMCEPVHRRGHPRMDIVAWPNPYCRLHGVNNPACAERTMVLQRIKSWIARIDGAYYERSNWGNVAGPGLLFPGVHRYRRDLPDYHAAGVKGVTTGAYAHWINENPSMYVAAKLLWNCDADVDAMLQEFYALYYGPAAEPMRQYHELLEATMRDADRHAGTGLDIPHVFTSEVRAEAHRHLDAGLKMAHDVYTERIKAVGLGLDYTDAFCAMLHERDRHQYAAAAAQLDRAHKLIDTLTTGYEPPLLNRNFARTYLDLFFGNIVRDGANRTAGPNRFVVGFEDTWRFLTDPDEVGQRDGWWKPDLADNGWTDMRAYSDNWSAYDLRYYQGDAWYRQTVLIPKDAGGETLMLWFGAVDEEASVWLNGVHLGDSPDAVFKPFELPIGAAARIGEANVLAVRTRNVRLDEVGTGGLLAPVMIYAPGD